ncbi:hypothetical protein Glove_386g18 [Diversispora epigaea]|uniref:HCP-like protein n=1 Tax=Diversispora epigaea TaxID=1348612 RepID=A0A397H7B5_9GLOM|nr:hypothetical protein Glove_386g18 [Diversispora epigaea]
MKKTLKIKIFHFNSITNTSIISRKGLIGQICLGICYQQGIGTTKDEEKAFEWYMKSAEGGSNRGQFSLGNCYRDGIGITKDEEKAFRWYMKSAEGGNSSAQTLIGFKPTENEEGNSVYHEQHEINEEKIFHRYLKSAEENTDGQNKFSYCYLLGIGTTKDDDKAFQWYIKSAEGGNSGGQYSLANCYFNGIGTTKDEKKALHWYMKSYTNSFEFE